MKMLITKKTTAIVAAPKITEESKRSAAEDNGEIERTILLVTS